MIKSLMQICIFEDKETSKLFPLTLTRPAYLLLSGIKPIYLNITDKFNEKDSFVLHCRKEIEEIVKNSTGSRVNQLQIEDTLFINGRLLLNNENLKKIPINARSEFMICKGATPLAAKLSKKNMKKFKLPQFFDKKTFKMITKVSNADIPTANFFWDIINNNHNTIKIQSRMTGKLSKHKSELNEATLVRPENIFIGKNVMLKPGIILDATDGPIFIDNDATIMHNSLIIGPSYIGCKTIIKAGAKIYKNCSIGNNCKIGGEIESSIISSYTNKQHEGFLGHSYLGSWINLGAGTENSDLKNNYSLVNVMINCKIENSHSQFVGCCIGDHTKTGIKTMINTGSVFGAFCNLYGAGFQDKYIPSFSWGSSGEKLTEHDLDKAINTAKVVMRRRDIKLEKDEQKLFQKIHKESTAERKQFKIKAVKK